MSPEELMRQSAYTAEYWMIEARGSIDNVFGQGYATAHPELVAAFMGAAAADFATMMREQQLLRESAATPSGA